jgi:hypothetical protein
LITNCEKIDKRIEKFGEKWGNSLFNKEYKSKELEKSAFCDLLINNVMFFKQKFPKVNFYGIENYSQVVILLEGKYFGYLTDKKFFHDFNFRFK